MSDSITAPQEKVEDALVGNQLGQQHAKLAPFQVLKGIIVQPRATFTRLRNAERGHWWLVLLLNIIAISLLSFATVKAQNTGFQSSALPVEGFAPREGGFAPQEGGFAPQEGGFAPQEGGFARGEGRFIPPAATESVNGQTATPVDNASQSSTLLSDAVPIVSSVGGVVVGYLFCSFVVFSMSFLLGGRVTYAQIFRLAAWASLPLAFRKLVQAIASLVTGGMPAPGISAVMTTQEALDMPTLHTLLGNLDFYLIWSMVLLGVGTAVTSKLNKGKSATIVIIYLVLAVGVILGLMAASGALNELFGGQFNLNLLTGGTRLR